MRRSRFSTPVHFLLWLPMAALVLVVLLPSAVLAQASVTGGPQPPASPTAVTAFDAPDDHGHAIIVHWKLSWDDGQGRENVVSYKILRTPRLMGPWPPDSVRADRPDVRLFQSAPYHVAAWQFVDGEWDTVGLAPPGEPQFEDRGGKLRDAADFLPDHVDFRYRVIAVASDGGMATSEISAPAQAGGQVIHWGRVGHIGIPVVLFVVLVLSFVSVAQKGRELYIRPLAGINAVDDAIGRATEMNRPILYILGLGAADEMPTIASLTILSRVAKKVAEHRTELLVPCFDPVVMSVAQETVKQAYWDAGRPDEYRDGIVHYVTQEQWAYVAAVNGLMVRRQTAANFYLGFFQAESLVLAETGAQTGAIQIAGTDRTSQIPFFVVACDYTLIGEELYAASAYLGREPKLVGTLKAQDWAKVVLLAVMSLGVLAAAINPGILRAIFTMHID
ncbi:MAG: DUF6754 domain-containing protein [Candidatus Zixiibacteriota bacterium]